MTSIRVRLLLYFLGLTLFAWGATAVSTYYQTSHEVEEIYDAHLAQAAGELMALAYNEYDQRSEAVLIEQPPEEKLTREVLELEKHLPGNEYAPRLAFRMWVHGELLLDTRKLGDRHRPGPDGFSESEVSGEWWRVFTLHDDNYDLTVEVAEHYDIRRKIVAEVALASVYPALVAFPIISLLAWLAVGSGLVPLRRLTDQVRLRSPNSLEPVTSDTPEEVKPLVRALNSLLARLASTLERERRFTADASHELRTPLASLKVQAQVALRAENPDEQRRALAQIAVGSDRASRLVEQLLTLARLDPEDEGISLAPVDLGALCTDVISQAVPQALEKRIAIGLSASDRRHEVPLHAATASILVRNLLDNAIRYTPSGGRVEVRLREATGALYLEVADSGPGVPLEERDRVLDRFYRGLGTGQQGCGLGLSIVKRIAELHGSKLLLGDSDLGGLSVTIGFYR